jgi:hypothetical protein
MCAHIASKPLPFLTLVREVKEESSLTTVSTIG